MTCCGSQIREKLEDSDMVLYAHVSECEVILEDQQSRNIELWTKNDHFSGYVIEIDGAGYEFVRTLQVRKAK